MTHEQFVAVHTYNTDIDAQVAKGFLESRGIAALIAKDDVDGMFPNLQLTEGVTLMVPQHDKEKALALLKSHGT